MSSGFTSNKAKLYSDCRVDFAPHPITGDVVLTRDEDAVIQSIKAICFTDKFERFWQPNFGPGLKQKLFDLPSRITAGEIKTAIEFGIANHEPRATVHEVIVTVTPDQNSYAATIVFEVINVERPITISLLLERIR